MKYVCFFTSSIVFLNLQVFVFVQSFHISLVFNKLHIISKKKQRVQIFFFLIYFQTHIKKKWKCI